MEQLDAVQLFAGAGEFDWLAGDGPHGQRRAAAGIRVQLRHEDAVDPKLLVEARRRVHGVLTGHRVQEEHDLRGLHRGLDVAQLRHQRVVDVQTAGGVDEHHVVAVGLRVLDAGFGDLDGVALPHLEDGDADLLAHDLQLRDGGGTVHVAGHQQRPLAVLLLVEACQLGAVGRFTGALQTHQHDDRGRLGGDFDLLVGTAHQIPQLVVDDLEDLLRRGQALQHIRAGGLLGDARDEVARHAVVDVGVEERRAHLAHDLLDIRLRQPAAALQLLERL